jgi:NADH:ubiquinone oxidoreductase subunit C
MNLQFKLYFKYILFQTNQIFLKYKFKNDKNINVFLSQNNFYYLSLHLKLSSLFYSMQLSDIFAYDLPINSINKNSIVNNSIIVYNSHLINFQQRFFFFIVNNNFKNINKNSNKTLSIFSITELFSNANWLEREVSELNGIFFSGKKDLRNLMLQYGDTNAPFQKIFPSIGVREISYDSINDLLIQTPVSIQF